ncbi:MAG: amidohydrolase family protein [Spongiibacteraceae bacterium]
MEKIMLISADNHAGPPVRHMRDYLEQAYHDELDAYLERKDAQRAQLRELMQNSHSKEFVEQFEATREVAWHSSARQTLLEEDGVVAEVIFPDGTQDNEVPFTGQFGEASNRYYSPELQCAGQHAYNRWAADFCAEAKGRRAGLALVSFHDMDAAVRETEWAARTGLKGILIPGIAYDSTRGYGAQHDVLWAACVANDLTVNIHGGAGVPPYDFGEITPALLSIYSTEATWWSHRPLWYLMWSGVFERFPTLRVAFTEQFADWIPRALTYMDWLWSTGPTSKAMRKLLPHAPSFYWNRQCRVGASVFSSAECAMRRDIGTQTVMFGTDFPHPEGSWGITAQLLQATFPAHDVTEQEARDMLGNNAARFYGFDVEALAPVVERVGLTLTELFTPRASYDPRVTLWASRPPI